MATGTLNLESNNLTLVILSDCNEVSSYNLGWHFNAATGTTTNKPSSGLWGSVISCRIAGTAVVQLFIPHESGRLYQRYYGAAGWTAWKTFTSSN